MTHKSVSFICVAAVVMFSSSAAAGLIPGRWEKIDALPQGSAIIPTLETGERIEAEWIGRSDDALESAGKVRI
ncbi:MAG: hypothetical protein ACRD1R_08950 [Acidobacteriota bacterium]